MHTYYRSISAGEKWFDAARSATPAVEMARKNGPDPQNEPLVTAE
jgi:hypothetical protein